jgi:hypothetical protein
MQSRNLYAKQAWAATNQNTKHQTSNSKRTLNANRQTALLRRRNFIWILELGISLVFGV